MHVPTSDNLRSGLDFVKIQHTLGQEMTTKPQLPRIVEGQPVPNVSRREMKTLGTIVDDYVEMMPYVSLDLSDETVRENFRGWLLDFVGHAATEIEWAYRRATDSALEQAGMSSSCATGVWTPSRWPAI